MIVLSCFQVEALFKARAAGDASAVLSLDLGQTTVVVPLHSGGTVLPDDQSLTWAQLAEIRDNQTACFVVSGNLIEKVQTFSDAFNRFYSLMPTDGAPTMLVSGIPMHRIKGTNPMLDTLSKIRAIRPLTGHVLDTTMGLGYTAIEAAKTADHVTTVELDPAVISICCRNPWSRALFDNARITRIVGDVYEEILRFGDDCFNRIIHDPPTLRLAGELYSAEFYRRLYRVLAPGGRLFHYVGDPASKSGRNATRGVRGRLREVGFQRIRDVPQAFGLVALR